MNTDLPKPVLDAIDKLAAYADQSGYTQVIVSDRGSASFKQGLDVEPVKAKGLNAVGAIAVVWSFVMVVSSMIILGLFVFTHSLKLDWGWILTLLGAPWLLVGIGESLFVHEGPMPRWGMATWATCVFVGLAMLSKSVSLMVSVLFYVMGLSCFIFGCVEMLLDEVRSRRLRQWIRSRKAPGLK